MLGFPEASNQLNGRLLMLSEGMRPLTKMVRCKKERAPWGALSVGYSMQSSGGATEAEGSEASASPTAAHACLSA